MFSKQGFITVCLVILAALLITGCVPTTPAITPEPTRTPTPIPEIDETYPDLQEWLFGDTQNVTLTAKWGERDCKTWGPEKKPLLWNCQHTGIDYAALTGTPVYSATKGKVIWVEYGKDCNGLKCLSTVAIYNEATDVTFYYLHAKDIRVKKNDEVKAGDPIAAVGSRGPGGIHLHFEARPGEEHLKASLDVRDTINPYEAAKEAREDDYIVEFEDHNLEQAVREAIDKPEGPLYLSDVIGIEVLDASSRGIESIEGIQYLQNLEQLYLELNQVTDIIILQNLTRLKRLSFWYNQVTDISALQNLTNLEWLYFEYNQVTDISALQNLTNLYILCFRDNQVTDISVLVNNEGFGYGDVIDMQWNCLDLTPGSQNMQDIETLISRGVDVRYNPQRNP